LLDTRHPYQGLFFLQLDESHALCIASLQGNFIDARPHQRTLVTDQHDLVAIDDLHRTHDRAVAFAGLDADDTLTSATLDGKFRDHGTLAVPVLAHREDLPAFLRDDHVDDLVPGLQANTAYTTRRPAHLPHVGLAEAHGLTRAGIQDDVAGAVGDGGLDEFVAFIEFYGAQADAALVAVGGQRGLFHGAVGRGKEDELVFLVLADRQQAIDTFAFFQGQDVDDGFATRRPAGKRNLVDLEPVNLAEAGETQQGVVAARHQQVLDVVFVLDGGGGLAHTATAL